MIAITLACTSRSTHSVSIEHLVNVIFIAKWNYLSEIIKVNASFITLALTVGYTCSGYDGESAHSLS